MAGPDQFIKDLFRDETARATGDRVRFEVPPEIATRSLTPDGRITRAPQIDAAQLASLPAPLCHLRAEALVDFTVEEVGPGCRRIGPHDHDVLWIAANELPLRSELLPFLFVRSGRPLVELLTWAATVKGPDWVVGVLQMFPMTDEQYEALHVPTDPEEQRRIHAEVLRRWLRLVPEAADEAVQRGHQDGVQEGRRDGVQEGALQPLQHQFERRLSRQLTAPEQGILRQRLVTLGADRLGDVVLDMDVATLSAWLADPAAC